MGFGSFLERRGGKAPAASARFNLGYVLVATPLQSLVGPIGAAATAFVVAYAGGGLVALPSQGWALVPAAIAYFLAMDGGEFLFHRAQHAIPALWAMHSLHHSDPEMNVSTTFRHFWLEQAIKSLTIYLAVALILTPSPTVSAIYVAISLFNAFPHMNLRVGLGLALNSPRYHRIHHSSLPEHQNRNFAAVLPVFDLLGGTYYLPAKDEHPPTGLYDREQPRRLIEALTWPLRHLLLKQPPPAHEAIIPSPER